MQRRRIPGPVRATVHRPGLAPIREERARVGHVGARLGRGYEIAISAQFVDVVAAGAGQLIISTDHWRTFPGVRCGGCRCFSPSEALAVRLINQRVPATQELLGTGALLGICPVHVLKIDLR